MRVRRVPDGRGLGPDSAGTTGRQALAALLSARRFRVSPCVVKRAISKYQARATTDRTSGKAALSIEILTRQETLTTSNSP
jgi:hypothetical protein